MDRGDCITSVANAIGNNRRITSEILQLYGKRPMALVRMLNLALPLQSPYFCRISATSYVYARHIAAGPLGYAEQRAVVAYDDTTRLHLSPAVSLAADAAQSVCVYLVYYELSGT